MISHEVKDESVVIVSYNSVFFTLATACKKLRTSPERKAHISQREKRVTWYK